MATKNKKRAKLKSKKDAARSKLAEQSQLQKTITTYEIRVVGTARLTIDDALIKAVDDSWRKQFYPLRTPQEIAEHIGFNMMRHNLNLSEIDGFADRKDSEAILSEEEWDLESVD